MSQTRSPVDFYRLNQTLAAAKADADASEAHGILCGIHCVTGMADKDAWIKQLLGDYDPQDLLLQECLSQLGLLFTQTTEQIAAQEYALELLLRDDEEPLIERIQDLGEWCQGFLFGVSLSGVKDIEKLPSDASEIMRDILQISKAAYEEGDDEEENENAYTEVVEYVRVGTLVIYTELNRPNEAESKTIH
jgi:uncharacterized protein YgfB (UPF0149 family)